MTTVEDIETARFDEKIARDAQAGKLDHLAEQAIADFRKGRAVREIHPRHARA